ncbi:MAG: hypothetical protein JWO19_3944 [Bryobacterales bacterium]|nr:hypothetical protein [Bryobacterales bacterium]
MDRRSAIADSDPASSRDRARYFCTVRGETRIPSFNYNSLAMCSSPQVEFFSGRLGYSGAGYVVECDRSSGSASPRSAAEDTRAGKRSGAREAADRFLI